MKGAEENWSYLPGELVEKFAEFITSYGDYIRARAVCLSWQSALPKTPKNLPTQFPLLMLPGGSGTDTHMVLFSLAENKSYRLEIPSEIYYTYICGSCHGWLVVAYANSSLALFNPFTNAHIHLPSLDVYRSAFEYRRHKFVLSSSPSSSDFMAIITFGLFARLLFYRCGEERWTGVDFSSAGTVRPFADVIFYKQNQIVVLCTDGDVVIMDINIRDDKKSTTEIKVKQTLRAPYPPYPPYPFPSFNDLYLVEYEDEFLVLRKFKDYGGESYGTIPFAVYRLDWNKSRTGIIRAKWYEVKSLDNKMFFLGMGPSLYFSSSDFHGCRGNCIYFADDFQKNHSEGDTSGANVATFDLGDKQIKQIKSFPYELEGLNCLFVRPIWITPSPI